MREPQLGTQQMLAAEDVQRQVTVMLVVAVKETAQLMPVQRIVGRVQIQHDRLARLGGERQKRIDKPVFQLPMPRRDLLIAALRRSSHRRQFQAIERAFAGQRLATVTRIDAILARRVGLADQDRQQWIGTQPVVVVEVFIAQRQAEDTLLEQLFDRVFDLLGVTVIVETSRQPGQQTAPRLDLPQQQRTSVRADRATVESGRDLPRCQGMKFKREIGTLCLHRAASLRLAKVVLYKTTYAKGAALFQSAL
jgi:hypothetical protein